MSEEFALSHNKSAGDLGREAASFAGHTLLAVLFLTAVVIGGMLLHTPVDEIQPKLIGTLLAFAIPLVGGLILAKILRNPVAGYVWIAGVLIFAIVCVWVLDLPTGPGLCEKCGAVDKLYRTFFDIEHGSGLMGGDGLLIGTWLPLSLIGYSLGAKVGLNR
jgi:hypothetical protein